MPLRFPEIFILLVAIAIIVIVALVVTALVLFIIKSTGNQKSGLK
jgi:hypothetical protein